MHYDLGYIDLEQGTLQTIDKPEFGTRLSPMSQVQTVTHVSGRAKEKAGRSGSIRTCDPLIPNQEPSLKWPNISEHLTTIQPFALQGFRKYVWFRWQHGVTEQDTPFPLPAVTRKGQSDDGKCSHREGCRGGQS